MIRSILIALDDTPGAAAARDLAIFFARRDGSHLAAAVVMDLPHTRDAAGPVPIGGGAFLEHRNAALVQRAEAEARAALDAFDAAAGDLPVEKLRLEEAPEPALLRAAAGHDLLVIGRDSTLGQESSEDGLAPVIEGLLRHGARPLLVVPPRAEMPGYDPAGAVLVGYDASIPAQRALQIFALMKPEEDAEIRVVSVDADAGRARALAEEGRAYLSRHGFNATALAVEGDRPADLLLEEAARMKPRLAVLGSFEVTGWRGLISGSATRKLLRMMPCPVFIHH
ncbi:universal stress protein [Pseudoroseomonas globiformis]|uniref:Universal stress protein n=1 Tax=Teichococcus globiformis TaxID=2307229 RepID=A0ABV7G5D6_9PROT